MVNYSVTNYNPYSNQNIGCNSPVCKRTGYGCVPSFTSQPDTVELSTKKEGLSNGAKWGIGTGVVLGLGALAYVLTRGRVGSKQAQKLAEHIEFKPATTIEEAKKFAKDKLGVHYNDIEDVGALNFFNEWLTGVHNKCKRINKSSYPKFITNNKKTLGTGEVFAIVDEPIKFNGKEGYLMEINMPMFSNFKVAIDEMLEGATAIQKDINGKYNIVDKTYQTEAFADFIERINNISSKTTFKEKVKLINDMKSFSDGCIVNGQIKGRNYSDFYLLNHELGHLRHQECVKNYNSMKKVEEFETQGQPVSDITNEFVSNKQIQQTARKVSDYATESPLEFVAETFAQLMEGKTFSDDVMALYQKYGGPILS